jgi:hypothetical protein
MITINDALAPVLVAAIRDAYKLHSEAIDKTEVGDVSDMEEFLVSLGTLEAEVRRQYIQLETQNRQMIPYRKLWPEMLDEPPDSSAPKLKSTD